LFGGDAPPGWNFEAYPLGNSQGGSLHIIESHGLAPKCHPCCGSTHKSIDNLLDLKAQHGELVPENVASMDALVNTSNVRNLCFDDPQNEMEARFSMQYCLAVALKKGFLSLQDFTPEVVLRPDIRSLLPLTTMSATPPEAELDPSGVFAHELTVTLKSGDVLKISRTTPRGTLGDPFTDDDRRRKFEDCCLPTLGADATNRLYQGFNALATHTDIKDLMKTMAMPSAHMAA